MKHRRKTLIALLSAVIAVGLVWYTLIPQEPEYQGRRLREWLEDIDSGQPAKRNAARTAFLQMGAKAVPFLTELLGSRSSFPFKLPRLRWVKGGNTYNVNLTPARIQTQRAITACRILEQVAKPAIPALAKVLENGDYTHDAVAALRVMGPDALHALTNAFASPAAEARKEAVTIFQRMPYDAQPAIAALIGCLKDTDANVRIQATQSLASIGKQPDVVVPALIQTLADPIPNVRFFAINALRRFGEDAKPAVPLLLTALNDTNAQVSSAAAHALKQIAPQAAAETKKQ